MLLCAHACLCVSVDVPDYPCLLHVRVWARLCACVSDRVCVRAFLCACVSLFVCFCMRACL